MTVALVGPAIPAAVIQLPLDLNLALKISIRSISFGPAGLFGPSITKIMNLNFIGLAIK